MRPLLLPPVHKSRSALCRRSRQCDVRGVIDELCPVQAHRFALFYSRCHSRFAPGFAPDSRATSIALPHTRSGRIAQRFNANIAHGLTPSQSIPISTDRLVKAKAEAPAQARLLVCASHRYRHSTDNIHLRNCPISTRHSKMTRGGATRTNARGIVRVGRTPPGAVPPRPRPERGGPCRRLMGDQQTTIANGLPTRCCHTYGATPC